MTSGRGVHHKEAGERFVAVIDGLVTQITMCHIGRGKFRVRQDMLCRFEYRIIDASDIICLAEPENSRLIVDSLFSGHHSKANAA